MVYQESDTSIGTSPEDSRGDSVGSWTSMANLSPLTATDPTGLALQPHQQHKGLDARDSRYSPDKLHRHDMPSAFGLIDAEVPEYFFYLPCFPPTFSPLFISCSLHAAPRSNVSPSR
jgi:hypothetical protein